MKTILKTFPSDLEMKYDQKFGSEENTEILREVIPRLVASLKRYDTPYRKVKEWLNALHKHRRVRLLYSQRGTLDRDNRRLHKNNRINEVNNSLFFFYKKNNFN
jgi:hypothetical protein